jgi:hypothetical protein
MTEMPIIKNWDFPTLYSGQVPSHVAPHQKFHPSNFDNHGTHHLGKHFGGHYINNINLFGIISQ